MKLLEARIGDYLSSIVDIYSNSGDNQLVYHAGKKYKIIMVDVFVANRIVKITTSSERGFISNIFDTTNFNMCMNYRFTSIKEERKSKIESIL